MKGHAWVSMQIVMPSEKSHVPSPSELDLASIIREVTDIMLPGKRVVESEYSDNRVRVRPDLMRRNNNSYSSTSQNRYGVLWRDPWDSYHTHTHQHIDNRYIDRS